jgi:threonine synthase
MTRQWLECLQCHQTYPVGPMFGGCPECKRAGVRSPVEMRYDYEAIGQLIPDSTQRGIWRWHALLPRLSADPPVSLGEGATPLCPLPESHSAVTLLLKNETVNPTWSYKDRASSVNVSVARDLGFHQIAATSTGNFGNSHAAYATAAGLRCVVFCHAETSALQVGLMQLYGAEVISGGQRTQMMRRLIDRGDWFPCYIVDPIPGFGTPFGIEGYKTIAFEIFMDLDRRAPDRIFFPVGGGDGLYGVWKGFVELMKLGLIDRLPRMYSAQSEGAPHLVNAFSQRLSQIEPVPNPRTVALSIAEEVGGQQALHALYASCGSALSVTDEEILTAAKSVARSGYAIEPASAAAVACANKLMQTEPAGDETWIVVGTGAFIKWPETLLSLFTPPQAVGSEYDAVEALVCSSPSGATEG